MLAGADVDYIPCIAILRNGNQEAFLKCLDGNNFLIEDGKGDGEGIVIKNYDYKNKYGRTTWAKIVTSEFKEKHQKEMGPCVKAVTLDSADRVVDEYCTTALIEKVYAKIVTECDGWSSRFIPRLLNTVYYELVCEECWNFVKKFKNPTINFKRVQQLVVAKIKEKKPELF